MIKSRLIIAAAICAALSLVVASCASLGSPDGGRFDEEPPYVVAASPLDRSVGQHDVRRVRITFNEYVKLENASEKVVISPPQHEQPDLYLSGKSVVMTLYDTLQANTTYTIDFGDAIVDNNEGNPFGNYTYSFSTGESIDTLAVGGHVIDASNLEPVKGILVGLYRIDRLGEGDSVTGYRADSTFITTTLERVARTDANGAFSIKGVAPGRYHVYALKDMDGDYRFSQKSEMLAFDHELVVEPWCARDLRHDTIWADSTHYERILHSPYMHFYPDDVVLRAFLEEGQAHYLLKSERPDPLHFKLYFTAPSDTVPLIEVMDADDVVNDTLSRHILLHANATRDTLNYWVADTTLAYRDTLHLRVTYLETDSLNQLVPRTDTLRLLPRTTRARQIREREEKVERWHRQQVRRLETYERRVARFMQQHPDSVYPTPEVIDTVRANCPEYYPSVSMNVQPGGTMSAAQNLRIVCPEPIASVDTSRLHFAIKVDTVYHPAPYHIERDSLNPCVLHFYAEWRPSESYQLTTDSLTFTTVYDHVVMPITRTVNISSMDVYGALFVQLRSLPTPEQAVVQLINSSDKVTAECRADANGRADFFFITPGTYYLRCFIDSNDDGKWTTGEFASMRQAETMYYFPQALNIRAKWEVEQAWDVNAIPVMQQKPAALIKQRDTRNSRRSAHERNVERDRQNRFGQRQQ